MSIDVSIALVQLLSKYYTPYTLFLVLAAHQTLLPHLYVHSVPAFVPTLDHFWDEGLASRGASNTLELRHWDGAPRCGVSILVQSQCLDVTQQHAACSGERITCHIYTHARTHARTKLKNLNLECCHHTFQINNEIYWPTVNNNLLSQRRGY